MIPISSVYYLIIIKQESSRPSAMMVRVGALPSHRKSSFNFKILPNLEFADLFF